MVAMTRNMGASAGSSKNGVAPMWLPAAPCGRDLVVELSRSLLTAAQAGSPSGPIWMIAMVPGRKTPEPPDEQPPVPQLTRVRRARSARRDARISPAEKASSSARADTAAPSASCSTVSSGRRRCTAPTSKPWLRKALPPMFRPADSCKADGFGLELSSRRDPRRSAIARRVVQETVRRSSLRPVRAPRLRRSARD